MNAPHVSEPPLSDATVNGSRNLTTFESDSDRDQLLFRDGIEPRTPPWCLRFRERIAFERPFPIQQRAIPALLNDRDLIVHSRAGSGKTVALSIAFLQRLKIARRTHELFVALSAHMGIQPLLLVGGTHLRADIARLTEDVQLVVSTPGRTLAMVRRGALRTDELEVVCLDEAHEFVPRDFENVLLELFQLFQRRPQVACFSLILPADFLALSDKLMRDPVTIRVE
ncbi:P-loop containing nucleoside triphosphate hydrolase protein [Mycena vulgaris]|nr:P-loop containing nucleoside triphosphate hydrolase protein [Mycena vulgaris]